MRSNIDLQPEVGSFADEAEFSTTLPSSWYTDAEVFRLEKERIFYRQWWYAGAAADVAAPGNYLTTTVIDQGVIVMRSDDGQLRGFFNVCQHRAHRLLQDKGCRARIVCPYHGWTYGNDGRLQGGRGVENISNFEPRNISLVPVRVEVMAGLLFVNLDADAHPLAQLAADMLTDLKSHCPGLDHLVHCHHHEVETAANWKTLVDNNLESYHVAVAHRALTELLDYRSFRVWESDLTTSHTMANTNPDNAAYHVSPDDPVQQAIYTWLFPITAFFVAPGRNNLAIFQMVPTGPETSRQCWDFYFDDTNLTDSEQALLDYTVDVLIPEDTALYENVQHGLQSLGYQQGRFVINRDLPEHSEHHVHLFQKLVRDAVLAEPAPTQH